MSKKMGATTRQHSNLRPKHKHTKNFLKTYHPFLPLLVITLLIIGILRPWNLTAKNSGVLAYATEMDNSSLVESTNAARTSNEQKPLKQNKKLSSAAQTKAQDMVDQNYWSHNRPNGQEPWVFINNAGYSYTKAGENLAYGFSNANDVVSGWLNSPAHRANVLDPAYQEVGFGFANSSNFDQNGPATVVVAMYGSKTSSQAPSSQSDQTNDPVSSYSTTLGDKTSNIPQVSISRIQTFTNGSLPWLSYAVGFLVGAMIVYLLLRHSLGLKNAIKKGERFAMKHPLLDVTLIGFIIFGLLIIQQVGVIQ